MSRKSLLQARVSHFQGKYLPHADHSAAASANGATPPDRILRLPEVLQTIGVGRTTLYKMIADGRFPAGIHISERIRGWRLSTILKFLASVEMQ